MSIQFAYDAAQLSYGGHNLDEPIRLLRRDEPYGIIRLVLPDGL